MSDCLCHYRLLRYSEDSKGKGSYGGGIGCHAKESRVKQGHILLEEMRPPDVRLDQSTQQTVSNGP